MAQILLDEGSAAATPAAGKLAIYVKSADKKIYTKDSTGTERDLTAGGAGGGEDPANKDASGGYVGLTLYKINMKNVAGTYTSFLTNTNTAARTYTWPDKDITVAGIVDITAANAGLGNVDNTSDSTKNSAAVTLTNKRITYRVGSTASSATPTINTDSYDIYKLTAQAADITSFTTNLSGTPTDGQILVIQITGTAARAITWGTSFEASTVALPTTTVSTNMLTVCFQWNTATSKWRCIGVA